MQDSDYDLAIKAAEASMKRLGVDYIDLYLIHQPFGDYYSAWRAMEKMYCEGKIRAIGTSNFDEARLVDLCMNNEIKPAVNQVEIQPFFHRKKQLKICKNTISSLRHGDRFPRDKKIFFLTGHWIKSHQSTKKVLHR